MRNNTLEIIVNNFIEGNSYVNSNLCSNGGGYSQPEGWLIIRVFDRYAMVKYADMSCGDFGSREYLEVISGSDSYQFNFGSMDDASNEMFCVEDYLNTEKGKAFEKAFGLNIAELYHAIF